MNRLMAVVVLLTLVVTLCTVALHAKDDVATPKEYGVYVKTPTMLTRLMPNVVYEERGVLYIESNGPQRFPLADVQQFVIYGKYDTKYLTLNPMLFVSETALHKSRFIFGKDIELEVAKKGDVLFSAKPKGLLGRGYYSLWINDTAWDFVIE